MNEISILLSSIFLYLIITESLNQLHAHTYAHTHIYIFLLKLCWKLSASCIDDLFYFTYKSSNFSKKNKHEHSFCIPKIELALYYKTIFLYFSLNRFQNFFFYWFTLYEDILEGRETEYFVWRYFRKERNRVRIVKKKVVEVFKEKKFRQLIVDCSWAISFLNCVLSASSRNILRKYHFLFLFYILDSLVK